MDLKTMITGIKPLSEKSRKEAKNHLDNLVKPMGSLGRLEHLAIQCCGIFDGMDFSFSKKAIVVFCADNGVYEEGVSSSPQEVTKIQACNMIKGITGVSVLAKQGNIDLKVVDIGIKEDVKLEGILQEKIAYGTKNIAKEPAMTMEEIEKAITVGFSLVETLKKQGYETIGVGEMGVGNTTTATSVLIALLGLSVEECAGKGAGLTLEQWERKKEVLHNIQKKHGKQNQSPLEVLRKMGGLDLAGMVGVFLGGAYYRLPIVIDGVISMTGALLAYNLNPLVKEYLVPSHVSQEPGFLFAAERMGIAPYFLLNMRLGEGSGCPFTMYLMDAVVHILKEMGTFQEGKVDKRKYEDLWEDKP